MLTTILQSQREITEEVIVHSPASVELQTRGRNILALNLHNLYECRYIDVLIKKMFSSITERNKILKPKALIHIFRTCCLRIFALRDPLLPQEQRIEVLMFCYWHLLSIRIRNWNNSIWRPGTDFCSSWSKTEICEESNKAETKDKFRSFKMGSTERLLPQFLPRGTVTKRKSLNTYLNN